MKAKIVALCCATTAALVTAFLVFVGTATAAIPTPTTPYPSVTINPKVCLAEAIKVQQAQIKYNAALNTYMTTLRLARTNAASAEQLRTDQAAVDNAGIALNDAKYAEATCQNNQAAPANQNCVNLSLEVNRLVDDLAYTQDLEAIAAANYAMALQLARSNAISNADFQAYKTIYQLAQLQTKLVQQQITDARKKATDAKCDKIDRPAPTPTATSTTTTPTSTQTQTNTCTQTSSAAPTDTSTPTDDASCTPPSWTDPCTLSPTDVPTWTDTPTVTDVPTPTDISTPIDACAPTPTTSPTPTGPPTVTTPVPIPTSAIAGS